MEHRHTGGGIVVRLLNLTPCFDQKSRLWCPSKKCAIEEETIVCFANTMLAIFLAGALYIALPAVAGPPQDFHGN